MMYDYLSKGTENMQLSKLYRFSFSEQWQILSFFCLILPPPHYCWVKGGEVRKVLGILTLLNSVFTVRTFCRCMNEGKKGPLSVPNSNLKNYYLLAL